MKTYLLIFTAVIFLILGGCEKDPPSNQKVPAILELPYKSEQVIDQNNGFGIDLFREVALDDQENLMISPLSASVALTMLLNGCGTETYGQIQKMLNYDGMTVGEVNATYQSLVKQLLEVDPDIELALANAVWYRNNFQVHQSYLDIMSDAFSAHIDDLDFASQEALNTINGWASENTNGKIDKVLDEISAEAVMFLMNALYFKGTWTTQFNPDQTKSGLFYLDEGGTVNADMMTGKVQARSFESADYVVAELPYGRQNFAMVVVVPQSNLVEFLEELDRERWNYISSTLDEIQETTEYDVTMPKFKFKYEKKLNDQLKILGMIDAFIPGVADLSGISNADIFVSFVKQNTFVDVNEEGTEAAAVTTIGIELTSINSFFVNKPFIFAIRERTSNTLLFIGKVVRPEY